ncbi:electron transport complex protein RnfC [Pelagirhabdus alkalitolerans]|uniref:Ion-translocating oxidoreductase complex subunit C n=1 Tax=Pelagirhabdus alkalitolerans TaxID=1612202 RepID=A0A1G6LPV4_9BACI|nr:electron transport complex subunit RsxC [Pelagirhabdus alkalitolerans]SDC45219.1 electron transport complex protein RnfC [Pelagirhabdus alkalitolerans]
MFLIVFKIKRKQEGANTVERKDRTEHKQSEIASVPEKLVFPLSMQIGAPSNPVVEVGDKVKVGTLIAENQGMISANIHSSVSGEVVEITDHPTAKGEGPCIIIKNDYQDEEDAPLFTEGEKLDREQKLDIIGKAGIVGMGGATFPTNVKLNPPKDKEIDTIIINGAECEPYATADDRLMAEHAKELIEGIRVLLEIIPVKTVYIGIEDNMHDAADALKKELANEDVIKLVELPSMYPQGSEKTLIKNLLGREVPPGKLPADVGAVVTNVGTTFAIYQAVRHGKPMTSRLTTISGESIKNPKNLWVRIGTTIESLLEDCEGFESDPGKMIHGGPMMGSPLTSGRVPITKGTTHITFLNKADSAVPERSPCIRCSECLNVCPVSLQPIMISNAYESGDIEEAERLGALDCIDCGACSYICPSKIPILDNIQKAKKEIRSNKEGA